MLPPFETGEMTEPPIPIENPYAARFAEIGAMSLRRHAERHAANPKRPAAAFLRVGIICVRELAHYARFFPELHGVASQLLADITQAAVAAEAACFAAGGNSAPYISLQVTAEGWRLRLRAIAEDLGLIARVGPRPKPKAPPPFYAPRATPEAHGPVPPRRSVPADQGQRRDKKPPPPLWHPR